MTDQGSELPPEGTAAPGSPPGAPQPAPLPVAPGQAAAPDPAPDPAGPLVAWEPPVAAPVVLAAAAGGYERPPAFSVGALLGDTFARYGADFLRLFLVAAAASAISWLGSFAAPIGSNPFGRPTGFVDVGGLLGLASFVVGIVGSSTMFALAEGGRAMPFGRALRRGIERAGWLFLTSLILGVAFIAVFVLALIPIGLFFVISPLLAFVPIVTLFAIFVWVGVRLSLALPANVVDNLNSIEAVKLSWRVTRPSGVWLRLVGAALLLGLLVLPAAIGALLLTFPAMFAGGDRLAFLLVPAVVFSLFTPLSALLAFSAYRRLVPPIQPSWTATPPPSASVDAASASVDAAPAGVDAAPPALRAAPPTVAAAAPTSPTTAPTSPAAAPTVPAAVPGTEPASLLTAAESPAIDPAIQAVGLAGPGTIGEPPPVSVAPPVPGPPPVPAAPPFRVPPFGTAAKAILALILAFDVAGLVAIPYGAAELGRLVRQGFPGFPGAPGSPGFPGFPGGSGEVLPGQVAFGAAANVDTCSIQSPLFIATASTRVAWVAALERTVTPGDEVFLRVSYNGQELETTLQDPGTYDCLGSEGPEPIVNAGVYTYEVLVNGSVGATGSLFVQ